MPTGKYLIAVKHGVQHIFIYWGRYVIPTGIYRMTRDINTKKMNQAIRT